MGSASEDASSNAPLTDIEFLARSVNRIDALCALAERPRSRTELRVVTGASTSTVCRLLREFEDRTWVVRDGRHYRTTELGGFVAAGFSWLIDRMETERTLRDVWQWLPTEEIGFDIELFADAVVTVPEYGSPGRTVSRFAELVEETETIRAFTSMTVKSEMEVLFRNVIDGMETELMWPSALTETILASHPEQAPKAIKSDNLTVQIADGLPCALAIFDDRVGLGNYDRETGILRAAIDTDAPEARRWAEELYESYRREARLLSLEAIEA